MRPSRFQRRSNGFALIAALALLVVLSSTGAAMIRMTGVQQAGASALILGVRANWAARSGIDWALHQAAVGGSCPAASTTLNLTEGVLSGFRVVVTCTQTIHNEGAIARISLSIRSEANRGTLGTRDYVYRDMRASALL